MNTWVTGALARGFAALTFASALTLITPQVLAEERVVSGKVVKVVPIIETQAAHKMQAAHEMQPSQRTGTTCSHPKPATHSALSLLIGWDLLHDCDGLPETEVITGYQVFYEWDERIYSRRMIQHPGATVTLLLTVD